MRPSIPLVVLPLLVLSGCAHSPLSAAALDETRTVAFIARIEDEAGPRSSVFRNDSSYRERLKRLDDKEGDRRLGNALTVGSTEKNELTHRTISRFEIADSLRSNTLARLPRQAPWSQVIHPVEVARVLESFLVHEVPANAPDYERLQALGADTVVEIVIEEYGMRSQGGKAGTYLVGFARMFRINGPTLYRRRFVVDDLDAGLEALDPFAVRKNTELFAARIKNAVLSVADQVAKDLTPSDRRESAASAPSRRPAQPAPPVDVQADDPL
jgi:hypothetical protein